MERILLTNEERKRFQKYCKQEANDREQLMNEMKRVYLPERVKQHFTTIIDAYFTVAHDIYTEE